MPRARTKEEKQKPNWFLVNYVQHIEGIVQELNLRSILTEAGVQLAINSVTPYYLEYVKKTAVVRNDSRKWLLKALAQYSIPERRYRAYRTDIIRQLLKDLNLIDNLKDIDKVVLMIVADNMVEYKKRLAPHVIITKFSDDEAWLRGRIIDYFKTSRYKVCLKDETKRQQIS